MVTSAGAGALIHLLVRGEQQLRVVDPPAIVPVQKGGLPFTLPMSHLSHTFFIDLKTKPEAIESND